MNIHSKIFGIGALVTAAFCFSCQNLCVKLFSPSIQVYEIIFLRFLGSLFWCLIISSILNVSWKVNNRKLIILHGFIAPIVALLFWIALRLNTPLSNATVLVFTYPIFGALFSHWLIKEKLKIPQVIAILFSFCGVYLVMNPSFSSINAGELCAVSAGIIMGFVLNMVRILSKNNGPLVIYLYVQILALIMFIIPALSNFIIPSTNDIYIFIVLSILSTVGPLSLIFGYRYCSVSEGGTIQETEIIFATFWGIFIFNEKMTSTFIIGSIIIIACGIFLTQSHRLNNKTTK